MKTIRIIDAAGQLVMPEFKGDENKILDMKICFQTETVTPFGDVVEIKLRIKLSMNVA